MVTLDPMLTVAVRSSAPYEPSPNGTPRSAARTVMVVPGCQYIGGRYQACCPLAQCQTPGCGGLLVTSSRLWIPARAEAGTGGSNSSTTGMPTPYVCPCCMYMP